jgi:uncharacterized protein
MRSDIQCITGDSAGLDYALHILRFEGAGSGPPVYLQAALHAQELPGVAALHFLIPMLLKAEEEGRLRSAITIVPHANPIGLAQGLLHDQHGRFDFESLVNFNRNFPLPGGPAFDETFGSAVQFLKSRLLALALEAEIVLDLHCDDEGPVYLYVPSPCWPKAAALADALGAAAVLTWEGEGGGAFEDAVVKDWLSKSADGTLPGKLVSTVELRGMSDVGPVTGKADGKALYNYLVAIGAVKGAIQPSEMRRKPLVRSQEFVDMLRTPVPGTILYHVEPGKPVKAGTLIAEILFRPGQIDETFKIRAPRDGFLLTRRCRRHARRGDDIAKIIGNSPSITAVPGPLEA